MLWHASSNCKVSNIQSKIQRWRYSNLRHQLKPPRGASWCYLPWTLTSATPYLPFPRYLEKQPGEQGMRLPCPRAGRCMLLPGEAATSSCSVSPLPRCSIQKVSLTVWQKVNFARTPFLWEGWKGFAARFSWGFCYQLAELAAFSCLAVADRELLIASLKSVSCSESTP